MRMLGALLGVPDDDGPWLVEKGDALLGNIDPEFTTHPVGLVDTDEFRLMPFRSPGRRRPVPLRARSRRARRRLHPTDDVISDLLRPTVDGERPHRAGVQQLLHAARRGRQRHHPVHDDGGAEGAHRASRAAGRAPGRHRRRAGARLDRRSRRSCAGPRSRCTSGARPPGTSSWRAGRSTPARRSSSGSSPPTTTTTSSPSRTRFDIHRAPNPHVAFGLMSPHLCLGAQLARMEIKVLLEELLPRLADVRRVRSHRAAALQLHQRHQAVAHRGRHGLTEAVPVGGRDRLLSNDLRLVATMRPRSWTKGGMDEEARSRRGGRGRARRRRMWQRQRRRCC